MRTPRSKPPELAAPLEPKRGTLILWGWNVSVRVDRGHLAVNDGAVTRRTARFAKAVPTLRKLVVVADGGGFVTFEALAWLEEAGASFVVVSRAGDVRAAIGPRKLDDVRLRRAQAVATTNGTDLVLTKLLLGRKLAGQSEALESLSHVDSSVCRALDALVRKLRRASSLAEALGYESDAASIYWRALAPVEVRFLPRDRERVPEHWRTVGSRTSPLSSGPRRAVNPANALLNYSYGLLEAEAKIALVTMGLDAGMGCFHLDAPDRATFAFDVMEAARPAVDSWALDLFASHRRAGGPPFAYKDFVELYAGDCRLAPAFAYRVTVALSALARAAIAPIVEEVVRVLEASPTPTNSRAKRRPSPTLLTESRRSRGRRR